MLIIYTLSWLSYYNFLSYKYMLKSVPIYMSFVVG
jgi:hypothetical protein